MTGTKQKLLCSVMLPDGSGSLNLYFSPAPRPAGRKKDDARAVAIHIACTVAKHLARTKTLAYQEAARMVIFGNPKNPDNQVRDIRRRLESKGLQELVKLYCGVLSIVSETGVGHTGFLLDFEPESYSSVDGKMCWFWQEGMRHALYGRITFN